MSRNNSDDSRVISRRFPPDSYKGLVAELRLISIGSASSWIDEVFSALGFSRADQTPVFERVLQLVQGPLKARTVLIEPYRSTDWGDEYTARYSRVFREIPRWATRLHFFRGVGPSKRQLRVDDLFNLPDECSRKEGSAYVGYCVVRPFRPVTLGDTVLASPYTQEGLDLVHCSERYTVHILGHELTVRGMPFIQQEEAVSVCAEANLWMLARYMHARGDARRYRPSEMFDVATRSYSLGQAREGLVMEQMYAALKEMDLNPDLVRPGSPEDAIRLLAASVDSEIPVIVAIPGHVFTVIGHSYGEQENKLGITDSAAAYIHSFIAHDDQQGPYRELKVGVGRIKEDKSKMFLTLDGQPVTGCLSAMPHRVYLREEDTRLVSQYWLKALPAFFGPSVGSLGKLRASRFVTRLYLRRSDHFKMDLLPPMSGNHSEMAERLSWRTTPLVARYWSLKLPRYIWVVELAEKTSRWSDPFTHRIVGEMLLDATSHWGAPVESLVAIQVDGQIAYRLGQAFQEQRTSTRRGRTSVMRHLRDDENWGFFRDPQSRPYSPLVRFFS